MSIMMNYNGRRAEQQGVRLEVACTVTQCKIRPRIGSDGLEREGVCCVSELPWFSLQATNIVLR